MSCRLESMIVVGKVGLDGEVLFFFFNDTATTEIYTLSLQRRSSDLAAIRSQQHQLARAANLISHSYGREPYRRVRDRKSTRLNSSHANISYAVFCLKKKNLSPSHLLSRFLYPTCRLSPLILHTVDSL